MEKYRKFHDTVDIGDGHRASLWQTDEKKLSLKLVAARKEVDTVSWLDCTRFLPRAIPHGVRRWLPIRSHASTTNCMSDQSISLLLPPFISDQRCTESARSLSLSPFLPTAHHSRLLHNQPYLPAYVLYFSAVTISLPFAVAPIPQRVCFPVLKVTRWFLFQRFDRFRRSFSPRPILSFDIHQQCRCFATYGA